MDATKPKERRKRKRKTDGAEIKVEDEPEAKRQKVTFEAPAELLLDIFAYLGPTDLIVVGRVCRFWNECSVATSCWRLHSTCFVKPTGISWEVDRYFKEHDGFLKAEVKYTAPKYENLGYRDVHSFELYYKGEYLARYEIVKVKTGFIRFGTVNILEDFILEDPESSHDASCWALEARIIPDIQNQEPSYMIGFSLFYNEFTLLSFLRKKQKFPKQKLLSKGHLEVSQLYRNRLYSQCWNITTHPCEPILVGPEVFGDSVKLFDHQYRAVNWMLYIESQPEFSYSTLVPSTSSPNIFFDMWNDTIVPIDDIKNYQIPFKPKGGILADDFGLGKTISAICLVLADKKLNNIEADLPKKDGDKFSSNSTLVICPATLINQWQDDLNRFSSQLSFIIITEPMQILSTATDVALISVEAMWEHFKMGSALFNVEFRRIILDESHRVLRTIQRAFDPVNISLSKKFAWCLSATPFPDNDMINKTDRKSWELVMEFLEFPQSPSADTNPITIHGYRPRTDYDDIIRYNQQWTMMSTLMWCTKRGYSPELNFSTSTPEIVRIDLTPFEQAVIDMSRDQVKITAIVCGVNCYRKPLDTLKDEEKLELMSTFVPFSDPVETQEYIDKLESLPYIAADPKVDPKTQMINIFGSKLAAIINWVEDNVIKKGSKCIIFSKYPAFLQYVSFSLYHYGMESLLFTTFYPDLPPDDQSIKIFKKSKNGVLLMVLDTEIISGLHFEGVEYIVLLDPLIDVPAKEDEYVKLALGRVTSIGAEQKDIKRVRFIINNTMDEIWYENPEIIDPRTSWNVDSVMREFMQYR